MSVNHPTTSTALVARTPARDVPTKSTQGLGQYTFVQRLIVRAGKIKSTIGWRGIAALSSGAILAVGGTLWAILIGVPEPLAIMAGYCTLIGGACLCAALLVAQNITPKASPIGARRQPNYAAWKLVSKLSVSDASRLWCDIEPGGPASQESIAWAQAMLDAIKRSELPVSPKSVASPEAIEREKTNPNWHTEMTREALKSWASAHGHSPRFLQK